MMLLDTFNQDVKQDLRHLRNAPVFLTSVVLTLGIGIGATTTIFVSPMDPVTFATISGLLLAVAVLASYIPARRAARIARMQVLRDE